MQEIDSNLDFIVGESPLGGLGCFANCPIPKGQAIWRMNGRPLDRYEALRSARTPDDPLQIAHDLFLELDETSVCFNHSCDPNALLRGEAELFAIRDIAPGEEIAYDYSTTVPSYVRWTMRCACRCGSSRCRGTIGNVMALSKEQLDGYMAAGGVQDFIRRQLAELETA